MPDALGATVDLGVLSSRGSCGSALLRTVRRRTAPNASAAQGISQTFSGVMRSPWKLPAAIIAQGRGRFRELRGTGWPDPPGGCRANSANVLKESLPTGHERSISATLLKSIRQLGRRGAGLSAACFPSWPLRRGFEVSFLSRGLRIIGRHRKAPLCEAINTWKHSASANVPATMRDRYIRL